MTKYFSVRLYPKSHTDAPPQARYDTIVSTSKADYEQKLAAITKGCEDWQVIEVSKDVFNALI